MNTSESVTAVGPTVRKYRRKQFIVDSAFQWKHAITIALTVFLITSIMSSVLYGILHQQARMRFVHPETFTGEVTLVVLFAALVFSAVTALGMGFWSIIATHRICGPLYVLENYLGDLAKGKVPSPRPLRKKDEFQAFYRSFTRAMDALKVKRQAELSTLCESVEKAKSALEGDAGAQKRALELMAVEMEKLRDETAEALGVPVDGGSLTSPMIEIPEPRDTPVGVV